MAEIRVGLRDVGWRRRRRRREEEKDK
jgi:hypothetical protein